MIIIITEAYPPPAIKWFKEGQTEPITNNQHYRYYRVVQNRSSIRKKDILFLKFIKIFGNRVYIWYVYIYVHIRSIRGGHKTTLGKEEGGGGVKGTRHIIHGVAAIG